LSSYVFSLKFLNQFVCVIISHKNLKAIECTKIASVVVLALGRKGSGVDFQFRWCIGDVLFADFGGALTRFLFVWS